MSPQDIEIPVDTGVLAVRDHGGVGQPLILVHTPGWSLELWTPLAELLTDQFHVYSFDLRRHGHSTAVHLPACTAWHDLETISYYFNLGPAILLGHDMGAFLACVAAIKRPDLFTSVIGVDAAATLTRREVIKTYSTITDPEFHAGLNTRFTLDTKLPSKQHVETWAEKQLDRYRKDWTLKGFNEDAMRADIDRTIRLHPDGTFRTAASIEEILALYTFTLADEVFPSVDLYEKLPCPSLTIHCRTGLHSESHQRLLKLMTQHPFMEVVTINAGHMAIHSSSRDISTLVKEFASEVYSAKVLCFS
ncbi:alpha/beta fold hydrolase [Dermatophilus congolensis]|uniref:alpha/beta fold hydrolase n=1 Tax=Dermatophilus congolensis TaxID=1863 RepID=UPI001AAE4F34|nr:alpha/beta hydrolase [Dermatophilus congolensis]MBO3130092.1 alpha/beta hydrolase [Dermatophilus congolensis]MBO3131281.1 alpha/beta hydrolase [Dermatophilus congolensis]MBO3134563.1 alpha/beta hydrolase [Dermatophilus congolensis]MBO3136800.1 alpha/beta hydrolase [Dermatophilus congolensis]MBO3139044.1 alpha/beta hydrolase [Dermatophilus congolensis]